MKKQTRQSRVGAELGQCWRNHQIGPQWVAMGALDADHLVLELKMLHPLSDLYTFSEIPSPHKSFIRPMCVEFFLWARHCFKCSGYNTKQNKGCSHCLGLKANWSRNLSDMEIKQVIQVNPLAGHRKLSINGGGETKKNCYHHRHYC